MSKQIEYHEKQYFQKNAAGHVSMFLDFDELYKEYIEMALINEQAANAPEFQSKLQPEKRFKFGSCTVKDGIRVDMQSKFELLKSNIKPVNKYAVTRGEFSELFFAIQIRIMALATFEEKPGIVYRVKDFKLK